MAICKKNIHAKSQIMANKQDTRIAIHHAHNYNSTSKLSASMQPLWNIVQYATLFTRLTIHFIRFYTCFSSQGGCSDSSHRRTQNTSQSQQSQIVLLGPHQDRTKQGRRCKHAIWSLADFWLPSHGCSWQDLPTNLHGHSIETWSNYFRWNLSIRRSVSTFRDLQMSQLHILLLVAKTLSATCT